MEKIEIDEETRKYLNNIDPDKILFSEKIDELIDEVNLLKEEIKKTK